MVSLLVPFLLLSLLADPSTAPFPRNDPRSVINPLITPWWCKVPKFVRQVLHLLVVKEELNERGPCSAEIPPDRVYGEPEPEGGAEPEPEGSSDPEPETEPQPRRQPKRKQKSKASRKEAANLYFKEEPLEYAEPESEPESQPESQPSPTVRCTSYHLRLESSGRDQPELPVYVVFLIDQ